MNLRLKKRKKSLLNTKPVVNIEMAEYPNALLIINKN